MSDPTAAIQRGFLLLEHGREKEALDEFGKLAGQYPDNASVLFGLSRAHLAMENWNEAEEAAHAAIQADPEDSLGHYALAYVGLERNRFVEALRSINQAIELDPYDSDNYILLASIESCRRNWSKSEEAARRGLEIDPEDASLITQLSYALQQQGKSDVGIEHARKVVEQNPEDADAFWLNGQAKLRQGQYKQALEDFRESLRLDPGNPLAKEGLILALKSHYWPYRVFLSWVFWMNKFSYRVQIVIVIALFLGMRMLRQFANNNPVLSYLYLPLAIIYIVFAGMTWWADSIFDLLIRLSKYGRHAVDGPAKTHSNWMGLLFGGMIIMTVAGIIGLIIDARWAFAPCFTTAILLAVTSLPASVIMNCDEGWPRTTAKILAFLFGSITIVHFIAGTLGKIFPNDLLFQLIGVVGFVLFLLGAVAGFITQFVLAYVVMATPKK